MARLCEPCPYYSPLTDTCEYGDCTPDAGCVDRHMADADNWLNVPEDEVYEMAQMGDDDE